MKAGTSRIELRYPQQRIASHSDSIQDMESLFGRSKTHHPCENRSQEPDILHNNQRVDAKTGKMGRSVISVRFQDYILQRK